MTAWWSRKFTQQTAHHTFSTMPRLPADITFRTMPPARSAMQTDAATNFSTMPGSLVFCDPAAAIVKNVRRLTAIRELQHRRTTAGNNGRSQRFSRIWAADTSTADACIDLYLRPADPPVTTQPQRTIDRHNEHDCKFSILKYRTFYQHRPRLSTARI